MLQLCKALGLASEHTLVVGNSLKDWPMMSVVSHSCAVMNAEPLLKERARYTLNPIGWQLSFVFLTEIL